MAAASRLTGRVSTWEQSSVARARRATARNRPPCRRPTPDEPATIRTLVATTPQTVVSATSWCSAHRAETQSRLHLLTRAVTPFPPCSRIDSGTAKGLAVQQGLAC